MNALKQRPTAALATAMTSDEIAALRVKISAWAKSQEGEAALASTRDAVQRAITEIAEKASSLNFEELRKPVSF